MHSRVPSTGPCPAADESAPRSAVFLNKIHLNIVFQSTSRSYKCFMNFSSLTQLFLQLLMKFRTSV